MAWATSTVTYATTTGTSSNFIAGDTFTLDNSFTYTTTDVAVSTWTTTWSTSTAMTTMVTPADWHVTPPIEEEESRESLLRDRLRRMRVLREENAAERKGQELIELMLGKDRLREYLRYGSLRLSHEGAEWDIGANTLYRQGPPPGVQPRLATWPEKKRLVGLNVIWKGTVMPRSDRVLGLFLELVHNPEGHDNIIRECCHTTGEEVERSWKSRRRLVKEPYFRYEYLPDPLAA